MKQWFIVVAIILGLSVPVSAAPVNKIYGANADATGSPLPLPLTVSKLCDGSGVVVNCPQFFHPDWSAPTGTRFFGVTNRANPPFIVQSIDNGATWTTVATQPFGAAILNFGAKMAVASDGSILVAAGQGADKCIIRRSIDQGANWTTTFSNTAQDCTVLFSSPTPPEMYCASESGYCAIVNPISPVTLTIIYSGDNGQNWTIGTPSAIISADSRTWGPILSSGGTGLIVRGVNASGAGNAFAVNGGGDFVATSLFAAPVNLNCRPVLMGGSPKAVCAPNAGGGLYRYVDGTIPSVLGTFTPNNFGNVNPQVVGFNSTTGYMVQVNNPDTTKLDVYVTTNTWGDVIRIGQITPAFTPVAGCCSGNFMVWGRSLYFSSGGSGSGAFFFKISP